MKNLFVVLAAALLVSSCSTMSSIMPRSSNGLRDYSIHTLSNGMNVLTVRDESLPYLTVSAFVMNGYAADPKDHTGLTNATLSMLDKGYHGLSADKISAEIEQLGAELDVDVSADYSVINLDGLSWQEGKLLEIFSNLILKPDFSEKELTRFKSKTVAEVKQRLDQPNYLASEIYDGEFYKNHPYGHRDLGSIQDIEKMTRKDIIDHYKTIIRPDQTWIVLVGQWSDDFAQKLDQTFSQWTMPAQAKTAKTSIGANLSGRDILLVDKSDAAQAEIRIGRDMVGRQDPDYLAIMVANTILGQGFSSRLMDSIRVKQGLTYSISSDLDMRNLGSGIKIKTFTKSESVGKTISEIYKTTENFYKNGVTQQELDIAKNYLIGKFPALVETPERLAFNLMVLRVFGVPDDYLKNYQANVRKITLQQVNNAIAKDFSPANLKIVIVANKGKVQSQLKDLGKLSVVEANKYLK